MAEQEQDAPGQGATISADGGDLAQSRKMDGRKASAFRPRGFSRYAESLKEYSLIPSDNWIERVFNKAARRLHTDPVVDAEQAFWIGEIEVRNEIKGQYALGV